MSLEKEKTSETTLLMQNSRRKTKENLNEKFFYKINDNFDELLKYYKKKGETNWKVNSLHTFKCCLFCV